MPAGYLVYVPYGGAHLEDIVPEVVKKVAQCGWSIKFKFSGEIFLCRIEDTYESLYNKVKDHHDYTSDG